MDTSDVGRSILAWLAASSIALSGTAPGAAVTVGLLAVVLAAYY